MDAAAITTQANDLFIDEDYDGALKLYTEALNKSSDDVNLYLKRAQTYLKLNNPEAAEVDAGKAVDLDKSNITAYLRHGTCLYELKRNEDAYRVCKTGLSVSDNKQLTSLLEKVKTQLSDEQLKNLEPPKKEEKPVDLCSDGVEAPGAGTSATPEPVEPVPMPTPKVKHDFYQTETHVIITILLKKARQEDFTMDVTEKTLSVSVERPTGSTYTLELDLAHEVIPDLCTSRVSPAKIEIKLKKKEGVHWSKLESEEEAVAAKIQDEIVHKYPNSRHTHRDWDKVAAEIKDDDEGDALNNMFSKIYKDASDDTKRAMVKSFTESGGTVLSTNWDEIGKQRTEVKPPEGMEHRKYEM